MEFLPVSLEELYEREIWQPDFILISADAYVDHPSFGHAVISRLVQSQGFTVGMIAQPRTDADFARLGEPKKAFLVSCGVVDSMVNNYTVAKNKRAEDVYSEGGKAGMRPDRVATAYCTALKRLFPQTAVIAGGVEPSLRRLSHYDYWSNSVMHSVLYDCKADLIIYGMGENPMLDILNFAKKNVPLQNLKSVRGTAYLTTRDNAPSAVREAIDGKQNEYVMLPSHDRVCSDKKLYCKAFNLAHASTDAVTGRGLIQKQDYFSYAVVNPPALPLTEKQMDFVYALPYTRKVHPMYTQGVPAIEEVEFSVTAHRGCFGDCSFCALCYHQGRVVTARSDDSIVAEVEALAGDPAFKGYIHDIGGPSANFHAPSCDKQLAAGVCRDKECIGFHPCKNLRVSHEGYLRVLRRARSVKGVKKVFIRSGLRFDYLLMDKDKTFFNELVAHHVSGQLKVAPEHCSDAVLSVMNKPAFEKYLEFHREFTSRSKKAGKVQYLVPYFISSHPGCTLSDAVELTLYLKSIGYMPKQVQDFYPTPSTLATTMYYTGLDPKTLQPVYVATTDEEKAMQRALLQYRLPANRRLVDKALRLVRPDLLGKI